MSGYNRSFPLKIKAEFSFFAVTAFMLCTDREGTAVLCLLSCFLHELGHIAVMLLRKRPPESMTLYGGGIRISGGGTDILTASAGCMVNVMLFAVFRLIPWEWEKAKLFAVINIMLACFNLLPVNELDGKMILNAVLLKKLSPEKALRVSQISDRITAVIVVPAAVMLVFSGRLSFSALIFFFYIISVDIFEKM